MSKILTDKELQELLDDESMDKSSDPKDAFIDTINPYKYIELDSNALAFDRIHRALNRNIKMTLVFGSPGTGKSMFLSRLNSDLLVSGKTSILISTPILDDEELFQTISFEIYKNSSDGIIPRGFNALSEAFVKRQEFLLEMKPILLLDEAQLYSNATLEKIRILSDTEILRVIFTVHKLREENIFTKEHFKSRIWERIELTNASVNELKVYIQKKLMSVSMLALADQFTVGVVKIIHNITGGNYRVTNNLLYTYFLNYPQIYKEGYPNNQRLIVRRKEIEVSAIQIGFLIIPNSGNIDLRYLPAVEQLWIKWRRKQIYKYFIYFSIPIILGYGGHFYLSLTPEDKIAIRTKLDQEDIKLNPNNNKQDKNLSFPAVKYSDIIEKDSLNINNNINITSDSDQNLNLLELEPIDIIELRKSSDENKNEQNSEIKTGEKLEPNNIEKNNINDGSKNIALDELGIDIRVFTKPVELNPKFDKLDRELPNFKEKKFKREIDEKRTTFDKNFNTALGIELLKDYIKLREYNNVWSIAQKLNELDKSLQEPYFAIYKILIKEDLKEDAKKIISGCPECIFENLKQSD